MKAEAVEIGDIVRRYGNNYLARYGTRTTWPQRRVLIDVARCRTAAMGGHVEVCPECGTMRCAFNSCRNRHCPKCLGRARQRWAAAREAELLPVPYFHVVFTLPHELCGLARQHPKVVYDVLFRAAAQTLTEVAADPRHLGARIGFIAVLHTWGQKLDLHPHVHCLVPGGGLSDDDSRWIASGDSFFLPVRVLSRVFRGKCLAMLRRAFADQQLRCWPNRRATLRRLGRAARKEWVVYSKPPFGGPTQVVRYLARYTHRVAIANHRIVGVDGGSVTFRYKDYADAQRHKTLSLSAVEFIRRFLLHVLPPGFTRIRHYGILANRNRQHHIALCRRRIAELALLQTAVPEPADSHNDDAPTWPSADSDRCPACGGGPMIVVRRYHRPFLAPVISAAPVPAWDTS
jgi:hypothetical protein